MTFYNYLMDFHQTELTAGPSPDRRRQLDSSLTSWVETRSGILAAMSRWVPPAKKTDPDDRGLDHFLQSQTRCSSDTHLQIIIQNFSKCEAGRHVLHQCRTPAEQQRYLITDVCLKSLPHKANLYFILFCCSFVVNNRQSSSSLITHVNLMSLCCCSSQTYLSLILSDIHCAFFFSLLAHTGNTINQNWQTIGHCLFTSERKSGIRGK